MLCLRFPPAVCLSVQTLRNAKNTALRVWLSVSFFCNFRVRCLMLLCLLASSTTTHQHISTARSDGFECAKIVNQQPHIFSFSPSASCPLLSIMFREFIKQCARRTSNQRRARPWYICNSHCIASLTTHTHTHSYISYAFASFSFLVSLRRLIRKPKEKKTPPSSTLFTFAIMQNRRL